MNSPTGELCPRLPLHLFANPERLVQPQFLVLSLPCSPATSGGGASLAADHLRLRFRCSDRNLRRRKDCLVWQNRAPAPAQLKPSSLVPSIPPTFAGFSTLAASQSPKPFSVFPCTGSSTNLLAGYAAGEPCPRQQSEFALLFTSLNTELEDVRVSFITNLALSHEKWYSSRPSLLMQACAPPNGASLVEDQPGLH